MTDTLQLLGLVTVACVATFLLDRAGRVGYGWVTGSEFLVAGLLLGPVGLDLVSGSLLDESRVVVLLGASWLGLRFGLRLRRGAVRRTGARLLVMSQVEPALCLLVLRGLLEVSRFAWGWPSSGWQAWLFAAMGAATTKSAVAWARSRHHASGPLSDALGAISELDDLTSVLAAGVLLAFIRPEGSRLPPNLWAALAAPGLLGLALAVLVRLIMGRGQFRQELAWVAWIGSCALAAGASEALGLSPLLVGSLAGLCFGRLSPQGDAFEEATRQTERPVVQVLLVLGGASLQLAPAELAAGALFALLRLLSKVVGGGLVGALLRPRGIVEPDFGAGLLAGGGVTFALAYSVSLALPGDLGRGLLGGACAMVLLGDFVGSPALKWLLRRAGELGAQPRPVAGPGGAP